MGGTTDEIDSLRSTLEGIRALREKYQGQTNEKYEEMKRRRDMQKLRELQKAAKKDSEQTKTVPKMPNNKEHKKKRPKGARQTSTHQGRGVHDASTTSIESSDESEEEKPVLKLYYTVSTSVKEQHLGFDDPSTSRPLTLATDSQLDEEEAVRKQNGKLTADLRQAQSRLSNLVNEMKDLEKTLAALRAKSQPSLARKTDVDTQLQQAYAQIETNKRVLEAHSLKKESIRKEIESEGLRKLESLNIRLRQTRESLSQASKKYAQGESVLAYEIDMQKISTDEFNLRTSDLNKLTAEIGHAMSLPTESGIEYCQRANKEKMHSVMELINAHLRNLSQEHADMVGLLSIAKSGADLKPLLNKNPVLKEKIIAQLENVCKQ